MSGSLLPRLRAALRDGKSLAGELKFSKSFKQADAAALCEFLAEQEDIRPLIDIERHSAYSTPLYHLVMPFQTETDDATTKLLRTNGLPQLLRLCDLALAEAQCPDHPLTMMAKMFAMYAYEPGVARVAAIARRFSDSFMVSVSFGMFGDERHPQGPALIELLREPVPDGFSGVLTLDLANTLSRQGRLKQHPFDTARGCARLESWLTDKDPESFSYAVSTAASLPFLSDAARNRLAALALDHPDPGV